MYLSSSSGVPSGTTNGSGFAFSSAAGFAAAGLGADSWAKASHPAARATAATTMTATILLQSLRASAISMLMSLWVSIFPKIPAQLGMLYSIRYFSGGESAALR